MKRRVFNVLTILSLLLGLATVTLWVRSHVVMDVATRLSLPSAGLPEFKHRYVLAAARGYVICQWNFYTDTQPAGTEVRWTRMSDWLSAVNWSPEQKTFANHLGFGFDRYADATATLGQVWLPYWFVALLLSIAPAMSIRGWLRSNRLRPGCCRRCGYDLRATPERCPECGTVPAGGTT